MTTNEQAEIKKSKAPKIVTWLAATVALMVALMKSGVSGDGSWSAFAASFFVHFLVVYFALWIVTKIVRKTEGEEKKTGLTVSSIGAAVVLLFIFTAMYVPTDGQSGDGLPECTSDDAVESIRSVVEKNSGSGQGTVELLDTTDLQEVGVSEDKKSKTCIGIVTLSTGHAPIKYTFYFAESDQDQVLIEVNEIDAGIYTLMRAQAESNRKEKAAQAEATSNGETGAQ